MPSPEKSPRSEPALQSKSKPDPCSWAGRDPGPWKSDRPNVRSQRHLALSPARQGLRTPASTIIKPGCSDDKGWWTRNCGNTNAASAPIAWRILSPKVFHLLELHAAFSPTKSGGFRRGGGSKHSASTPSRRLPLQKLHSLGDQRWTNPHFIGEPASGGPRGTTASPRDVAVITQLTLDHGGSPVRPTWNRTQSLGLRVGSPILPAAHARTPRAGPIAERTRAAPEPDHETTRPGRSLQCRQARQRRNRRRMRWN